ncbi:MAG: hypothetical protein IPK74_06405 [Deltaproteobacteria bacterium]|nr:hypothetical protein [Deltaproteobacteria bacterium]
MSPSGWLAVLVGLAAVAWPCGQVADACSLAPRVRAVDAPADGATDVPTNAVLWIPFDVSLEGDEPTTSRLRSDDGVEVALDVHVVAGVRVMQPLSPLGPLTRYTVIGCRDGACPFELRAFTTGAGPDLDPPAIPVELGRELDVERIVGFCAGTYRSVAIDLEFDGLLVADLGLPEFDERSRRGQPDAITTEIDHPLVVDEVEAPSTEVAIRVGVFDAAGNFSGWQELDPLEFGGCSCRGGDPTAPPLWCLAFTLLRRRRSRNAQSTGTDPWTTRPRRCSRHRRRTPRGPLCIDGAARTARACGRSAPWRPRAARPACRARATCHAGTRRASRAC